MERLSLDNVTFPARFQFRQCQCEIPLVCAFLRGSLQLRCLVLAEHKNGKLIPSTHSVISAAQQICPSIAALVTGYKDIESIAEEVGSINHVEQVRTRVSLLLSSSSF